MHVVCFRSTFQTVPVDCYTRSVALLARAGNSPLDKSLKGTLPVDEISSRTHPDFVKFMTRVTQLAKQREEGDVKSITINEE